MGRTKGPRGYETSKSANELAGQCQGLLADFGADSVHMKLENGTPVGIGFVIATPNGKIPFRLMPDIEGVRRRLEESSRSGQASPEATAWFQVKQYLEALLELNESGMASATELLGGMAVTETGATVAEMIEERPGDLLQGGTLMLGPGQS